MAAPCEAQFVIKNGSGSRPDVPIKAQLGGTVAELKASIHREYPGNPTPSEQTVCILLTNLFSCRTQRACAAFVHQLVHPSCYCAETHPLHVLQLIFGGKVLKVETAQLSSIIGPVCG